MVSDLFRLEIITKIQLTNSADCPLTSYIGIKSVVKSDFLIFFHTSHKGHMYIHLTKENVEFLQNNSLLSVQTFRSLCAGYCVVLTLICFKIKLFYWMLIFWAASNDYYQQFICDLVIWWSCLHCTKNSGQFLLQFSKAQADVASNSLCSSNSPKPQNYQFIII